MKISLNWLSDYVDVALPQAELADLFMRLGFCCEGVEETETDLVLDLEITSNRPDLLGHLGVARELAAATGRAFRPPMRASGKENPTPNEGRGDPKHGPAGAGPWHRESVVSEGHVSDFAAMEVRAPELCPRYTARVIRGVEVGPSPRWMVERLEAVGLRSVNNVVDVTNYVLMEYSQPLHSFDLDKLEGGRIVVRRAAGGERLVSIDETQCELDEEMLVIADARRPVAVAGIMGGVNTEVGEGTTDVLIESAVFDPLVTRRTSRRLGLMSESNYRFERGIDPVATDEASLRACRLILELAGGTLADGVLDAWARPFEAPTVSLRPERTGKVLGIDVPTNRQEEYLRRLGLQPERTGGTITCTIPPYRADLRREADLIEEVARLEGYDAIPTGGAVTHPVRREPLFERTRRQLREVLNAAGLDEAITPAFVDPREDRRLGHTESVCVDPMVRRTHNALRATVVPSLLRVCKVNQDAGTGEVALFELATVFRPREGDIPAQHIELGAVTTGELRKLRGALEAAVGRLARGSRLEVRPAERPGLERGTGAELLLDDEPAGTIGMLADDVRGAYGLERPVATATMNFETLLARCGEVPSYTPIPRFPPVQRDLSVIVPEGTTWREITEAIASVPQPMRVAVDYVTTYRGKPVPPGSKSVTATLTYRSEEGTLRSEQVDEQVAQVVAALAETLSAELRR